jgi:hemin uptake protein HemP
MTCSSRARPPTSCRTLGRLLLSRVPLPAAMIATANAELNAALDRLDESHTLFGGEIEAVAFEHQGKRRKSALAHTIAAGGTVAGALKTARAGMTVALRAVI